MMHVAFGSIATRSNQQQVQAMSANVPKAEVKPGGGYSDAADVAAVLMKSHPRIPNQAARR